MDELIIPTRFKKKIPQKLSYPVGAKEVSDALISVPQFGELGLCFSYSGWKHQFLEVRFWSPPMHEGWSEWQIEVGPVPRLVRHRFHEYIVETALPRMAAWLVEHAGLAQGQRGGASVLLRRKGRRVSCEKFHRPSAFKRLNCRLDSKREVGRAISRQPPSRRLLFQNSIIQSRRNIFSPPQSPPAGGGSAAAAADTSRTG